MPTTYTTYDLFNRPLVVTEKDGTTTVRTTTSTFDAQGRPSTTAVTALSALRYAIASMAGV